MIYPECPHGSWSDNGSLFCKLYNPYETDDKKKIVEHGTCDNNDMCVFKMFNLLEQRIRELDNLEIDKC